MSVQDIISTLQL